MTSTTGKTTDPAQARSADRALVAVLVLVIALGAALRCEGLARRPLWYDEVATTLHLSGRGEADVRALYDGRPVAADELLRRFQRVGPAPITRGVAEVVAAVADDEPQSGPGYFIAAYLWTRSAGDGRAALRALSALASLIAIPLFGLLACRLFGDHQVALAAMALVAVSPLHLRYAQEARSYALWTMLLLGSMLALLRAVERGSRPAWAIGVVTLAAALYVQPLSLLCLPAIMLLALCSPAHGHDEAERAARGTPRVVVVAIVACVAVAVLLWTPWLATILAHRATLQRTTSWSGETFAGTALIRGWLGVATSVFFRPGGAGGLLDAWTSPWSSIAWLILGIAGVALIATALADLVRRGTPRQRWFVVALAAVPFATLALADLTLGGRRSTVDRYLLPGWLGLELAVAFCLASPGRLRRVRRAVLLVLLALGSATILRTRPLDVWWNTDLTGLAELGSVAARLQETRSSFVLTDAPPLRMLELAHRLGDGAVVRLGRDGPAQLAPDEWRRAVLVRPSPALLEQTRRILGPGRALRPDAAGLPLWRVDATS